MDEKYLAHHGILGMKWGVRRYQDKDGRLTPAGKKRYLNDDGRLNEKGEKFNKKHPINFTKRLNDMTPDELNNYIAKLRQVNEARTLERAMQNVGGMTNPDPNRKPLINGREIVSSILTSSFKTTGTKVMNHALEKALTKTFGMNLSNQKKKDDD